MRCATVTESWPWCCTAANQDGHSEKMTTPSLEVQVKLYEAALAVAGVDAATVGVVEAHGTGIPVGDPLELGSLARSR
jgi:polyketide synthase 5